MTRPDADDEDLPNWFSAEETGTDTADVSVSGPADDFPDWVAEMDLDSARSLEGPPEEAPADSPIADRLDPAEGTDPGDDDAGGPQVGAETAAAGDGEPGDHGESADGADARAGDPSAERGEESDARAVISALAAASEDGATAESSESGDGATAESSESGDGATAGSGEAGDHAAGSPSASASTSGTGRGSGEPRRRDERDAPASDAGGDGTDDGDGAADGSSDAGGLLAWVKSLLGL